MGDFYFEEQRIKDSMIYIYKAGEKDALAVQLCCEEAFGRYVSLIGKKPAPMCYDYLNEISNHVVFVASNGVKIVGFVLIKDDGEDYMWMDVLAVSPEFSGKGIGRRLISYCENYILQKGKRECRLYTNVKFERTCGIYAQQGYEIYDIVNEKGYERYYMKKELGNSGVSGR